MLTYLIAWWRFYRRELNIETMQSYEKAGNHGRAIA